RPAGQAAAHGARRLEVGEAGEERQPSKQDLLRGGEQLVAPVERHPNGVMTRILGGRAGAEDPQAAIEALDDLVWGEHGDAGGGELDRQGKAVELPAYLGD